MPREDHVPMCCKILGRPAVEVIGHVLQKDVLLIALELRQNILSPPGHGLQYLIAGRATHPGVAQKVTKQRFVNDLEIRSLGETVHQRCAAIARTGPKGNDHELISAPP
jgi:hypothetical protein